MLVLVVAIVLALAATLPSPAAAKQRLGDGTGGVELRKLGEFEQPVHIDNAPGSNKLLFVVEQPGTISMLRGRKTVGHPFLDIRDLVEFGGEQGLLSVAFAPDYEQSRRFYVYYTVRGGDINRVDEFRATSATTADPTPARRAVIESRTTNSPTTTAASSSSAPTATSTSAPATAAGAATRSGTRQNLNSLLGKLLRIDPLPATPARYAVPPDNPFAGPATGVDEIYALGLRNPWRFSFDRKTDRLTIGDVGQGACEEVDYVKPSDANGAKLRLERLRGHPPIRSGDTRATRPPTADLRVPERWRQLRRDRAATSFATAG